MCKDRPYFEGDACRNSMQCSGVEGSGSNICDCDMNGNDYDPYCQVCHSPGCSQCMDDYFKPPDDTRMWTLCKWTRLSTM